MKCEGKYETGKRIIRRFKGLLAVFLFAVYIILFFGGCSGSRVNNGGTSSSAGTSVTGDASDSSGQPDNSASRTGKLEIIGLDGRKTVLDRLPEKIVSLSPTNTEILYAVGAGDKVAGVTDYCDYPEEAKSKPKIGDYSRPNLELIKAIEPDVILAGTLNKNYITTIEGLGIPVIVTEASNLDQIDESVLLIGKITGKTDKAAEIVNDMETKINEIRTKVKDQPVKSVFYLVWLDPIMTAGSGTYINDIIEIAGGRNVAKDIEGWPQYSPEKLIQDNPDYVISAYYATDAGITMEQIESNSIFGALSCVKDKKVHIISDDNVISRATPRVVQAIEEIAVVLHPEVFK